MGRSTSKKVGRAQVVVPTLMPEWTEAVSITTSTVDAAGSSATVMVPLTPVKRPRTLVSPK
jgi:hypothetical protein